MFKFTDGQTFKLRKLVTIPAKTGSKNAKITIDVIDRELLPLQSSRKEMKRIKANTDFDNDVIHIFGQDINISFTSSGYYFIPIRCTNQTL